MPHSKLDSKITESSLWDEKDHVIRVWIAFLAKKDENGFVEATHRAMKCIANVSDDPEGKKFNDAIKILESPDPNSKTPDFEGRRIEKIEGGWIVLNHEKYRLQEYIIREQTKARVAKFREKNKNVTLRNATSALRPVSVSVSVSDSVSVSRNNNTSNTCSSDNDNGKKKLPPPWKEKCSTFEKYQEWELEEFNAILNDTAWIREREEFHRDLDIGLTLKKAHTDFWSKKMGWKKIQSRRGESIDWRATWVNALTMKCNQVWKRKSERKTEMEEWMEESRRKDGIIS